MTFHVQIRRQMPRLGLLALLISLAACQSGGVSSLLSPGSGSSSNNIAEDDRIDRAELMAYCPRIELREGTAYFNTYDKAPAGEPQQDRSFVIYQASIGEVTRNCSYGDGQLSMTVAVAGKVIPGPKGKAGSVTLPIRIAVQRGDEVIYSRLHKHTVAVPSLTGATQYVFTDPAVTVPAPDGRNLRIYAGFDEGPYDTP